MKEDYQEFIQYVKSTWKMLFENEDWINKPIIDKIIVELHKGTFTVYVSLKNNSYYRFKDDDWHNPIIIEEYDSDEFIKTEYYVNEDILLHILTKENLINDLGLSKDKIFINCINTIDLTINKHWSKILEAYQEDYAEDVYCRMYDL